MSPGGDVLGPDGHLGPSLSALLDGELDPAARAAARAHLAECNGCFDEFEHVAVARSLVRALPPVEPPRGFYESILIRPRRRWWAGAWAATAAASVFVASLAASPPPTVRPPVPELVAAHAGTASAVAGDPITQLVPAALPASLQP